MREVLAGFDGDLMSYATMIIRFILPVLAIIIVVRCARSLLHEKSESVIWGQLRLPNGTLLDLNYWENVIGRAKSSDVFMEYPTISRNHAALIRDEKGNWKVYNIESKSGVVVNGKKIENEEGIPVNSGDTIELGGVALKFIAADNTDEYEQAASRTRPGQYYKQHTTLIYLTEFQLLLGLQLYISMGQIAPVAIPMSFAVLIMLMWGCYIFTRIMKRVAFEIETIGFFLSTIGLSIIASGSPNELTRQIIFIVLGLTLFVIMGWILRDLDRAKLIRRPIAVLGPLILAVTFVIGYIQGADVFGAIRWINIGGFSFQPVEFVKIALVLAGAATMERLFARRNLYAFIILMALFMGLLALMTDFGSAMIFFVTFLIIAYIRSGDFATIALSLAGAGFAGLLAISIWSHIARRFSTWGRAWEQINPGQYLGDQQVRAMSAAASGGLFGVGAGNGWLKGTPWSRPVFSFDSDIVFAMVSEEMGLIVAFTAMAAILLLAVFSARSADSARSSFYVIAACAASAILVFQMMLNVLGSMDIVPFTGVTFPFVSKGGTSLVACWGMLAFFKAADTRQNASFAVKTPKRPQYKGGGAIKYKEVDYLFWEENHFEKEGKDK